ncbi:MAG TPA: hypothetical protein VF339_02515 [Gammaproteobacteria bacterium]
MSTATSPPDASLDAYVDALLAPAGGPEPDVEPAAAVLELRLVEAAGLVFALPAAETAPAPDASGAARTIDLAAVATGRPSTTERPERIALENHPGVLLAVDAVDRVVEVPPDRVRWRTAGGARPWLAGMLDDPRAAVVSIRHLVEEA